MTKKIILKGMNEEELRKYCENLNSPSFHGVQLFRWMYKNNCHDIDEMKNIPKKIRYEIKKNGIIKLLSIKIKSESKIDKSTKFLLQTNDNYNIETVSMIENNRHTVCLSSQIGCSVDCDFCATGKMGIIRNLSSGEIIEQIITIMNHINVPITNIVFMGMGEPFLNYKNVIKSCEILSAHNGFNLSSKRITISTSGILPKIDLFIKEKHKYKIAISLNASNNKVRDEIMPINKKWNIESLIKSIKKYSFCESRPIMFEYVLLKNINDDKKDAIELANLLKGIKCKVNLIPFNEIEGEYSRPDTDQINLFSKTLNKFNPDLMVLTRWSKGEDINAACGQLATINES